MSSIQGYPVCSYCGNQHNYSSKMCRDIHRKSEYAGQVVADAVTRAIEDPIRADERARTIRELEPWLRHADLCAALIGFDCDCGLEKAKGEQP